MVAVIFQEDQFREHLSGETSGALASWLVRTSGGRIGNEQVANRWLTVAALIIFALTIFILWRTFA